MQETNAKHAKSVTSRVRVCRVLSVPHIANWRRSRSTKRLRRARRHVSVRLCRSAPPARARPDCALEATDRWPLRYWIHKLPVRRLRSERQTGGTLERPGQKLDTTVIRRRIGCQGRRKSQYVYQSRRNKKK